MPNGSAHWQQVSLHWLTDAIAGVLCGLAAVILEQGLCEPSGLG